MKLIRRLSAGTLGVFVASLCLALTVHATEFIIIEIDGDPSEKITGDCYLLQKSGKYSRQRIESNVPAKFWMPTTAVRCNFEKSDFVRPLSVKIRRGDTIELRQQSRPPLKWIAIRSSGPWGNAHGSVHPSRPTF